MRHLLVSGVMSVVLLTVLGCSDDGDSTARPGGTEEASVAVVHDLVEGRYGAFYDRLHPALKDQLSRGDYVECAGSAAGPVPAFAADRFRPATVDRVSVADRQDAPHATAGGQVPARKHTVRMEGGLESIDLVVTWIEADGRWVIVEVEGPEDSDADQDACVRWL